jgi:TonB-linked SusC/RagA family outer membrane protein
MKQILSILVMLCPLLSMCQPPAISGRIINENNEPVPAASISIHSTGKKTLADNNGQFTIDYSLLSTKDSRLLATDSLTITAVGYESKIISLEILFSTDARLKTIILSRKITALDDVLVIAYGTTTRRLSTGNVSKVSAAELQLQPVSNPLAALSGRVPGLVITQTSGVSGSTINVQLRGRTSLDQSLSRNDPLFIIDGVPFESGNLPVNQLVSAANNPRPTNNSAPSGLSPFNTINPADIESIEVLKDADATAIYGSRGAAGVILITTRKAKAGKASLNINISTGFSSITRSMNFLNTKEYLAMRREAFANDGVTLTTTNAPDVLLWDTTKYYDFKEQLIGGQAQTTDMNTGISGGSATTQFSIGGGYHRETAVFPGPFADTRASFRAAITHIPLNKKWELRFNAIYASEKNRLFRSDLTKYLGLPPHLQLYDSNDKLNWKQDGINFSSLGFLNPMAELERRYTSLNQNLSANLTLSHKLTSSLSLRTSAGYNSFTTDETSTIPRSAIAPENSSLASSNFANASRNNWIIEPQVEYNKAASSGNWNILIGSTFQQRNSKSTSITGSGYTNDLLLGSLNAAATVSGSNTVGLYRYTALFGRISYNWQQKYLVNISARRDGSSRFGPGRRFSNFGAAGAGWIITAEPWMQQQTVFSFLKLRSSFGITGNDQIGDYRYLDLWTATANPYQGIPGLLPLALYNPAFVWEKNKKWEAAVELAVWKDKITFSTAYFRHRSSNQLVSYRLPNQTGFSTVVKNLPALVQNSGWELVLQSTNISGKDFTWKSSLNITIPKNRLLDFPGLEGSSYNSIYVVGHSLSVISKFNYTGIDPATGVYTYEDVNADGKLSSPEDSKLFGDLDPKFYGGFSNTINWHRFSFDCFLEFRKQTGSNYLLALSQQPAGFFYNQPVLVLDRWQKPGDRAAVQRFAAVASSPAYQAASRLSASNAVFSDASYIRIKTIAVSMDLPVTTVQRLKIQSARFYIQAQNFFTITSYKGADPETKDFFQLPPLKTIVAGLQFNF